MPKIDPTEALAMHARGATDGEIAKQFGCLPSGVLYWRRARGLKPNAAQSESLAPEIVRQARKLLREGRTRQQVADALSISKSSVARLRNAIRNDARLRGMGKSLVPARTAVTRDPATILAELRAATRYVKDAALRDDVVGDMALAMLEGRLARDRIMAEARKYCGRAIAMWASPWGPVSIDEPMTEDGATLSDLIACPSAAEWLDAAGA